MVETDIKCSKEILEYFEYLDSYTKRAHKVSKLARAKGYDPDEEVEIKLAKNMAERVVGLISVLAPKIGESTVVERIIELEKKYGSQDWRVAMEIALEIAQQKHVKFETELEAIEIGVRTGFAYVTVGVVSSPLEGLTSIEIKPRRDGQGKFFRLNYAGPIRNAGGTAAATSVLIADYVRKHLGYAKYDPDEKEILRCFAELEDYHQYIANLQYYPFKEETEFLMKNIPVEIAGDPSEKRELSNASLKDLPRVETNLLRSGYCLIHSSCIPLKAPKLWKKLGTWGHEMGMEDWDFLEKHIKLQKELKTKISASGKKSEDGGAKVKPDGVFVKDLVGGRPVLGHPMRSGGFRLRYGRSRASGYSGQSAHPATLAVLNNLIATGTQLKVERPGKAAAFTPCDSICGPVVKLKNGTVKYLDDVGEASQLSKDVEEIIYLGDVLINYGDFFDRAHILVPPGYCEEYWILELKEALEEQTESKEINDHAEYLGLSESSLKQIYEHPIETKVSFITAKNIAMKTKTALHPRHTYFYKEITLDNLKDFIRWLEQANFKLEDEKIILPYADEYKSGKRALEILGIPHDVVDNKVIITEDKTLAIITSLNIRCSLDAKSVANLIEETESKNVLEFVNELAPYLVKDKSGLFIGSRMGRPEKAKMRKLTGSPHGLFPVGEEGGRLRSFQSALEVGKVTSSFPIYICPKCKNRTPFSICDMCESKTVRYKYNPKTKEEIHPDKYEKKEGEFIMDYKEWSVPIRSLFDYCLKKMDTKIYPDLIKGVRGTVGKDHTPEHLIKAILRAKHGVHVNKDGTVRYDASEITLTHFKPKEIGTSVSRLIELGYKKDIYGKELTNEEQILELKAQDLVLPACPDALDEGSDLVLLRTTQFIDEMLEVLYEQPAFYNCKTAEDLAGHLVIGLAPHTSAGTVGRIIGFSKTQGFLAHPLYHAAMRRDCDGDESCVFLLTDAMLNFSKKYMGTSRGSTMDAPIVLTTLLDPSEVDDMAFNVDIVDHYPLKFYRAADEYKYPWDIKIQRIEDVLGTEKQFEGMMFTHNTSDLNLGVLCSDYKLLPSMAEKIASQMDLAKKIRAVDASDVARLTIDKHFIRDTKGNLRKFSLQQFRCVSCNKKYRRPPLIGKCDECGGKILFTISEGSIVKYIDMSIKLAEEYGCTPYLKETLYLTKRRITDVFGIEKEKQTGLGQFMTES
ncbi:DNA polymerase II large subunit [Candidatus Woesearchaeota archaeon]|nr:DNA polymerase II large subunit [Candidatus Woesearchaeota archaeon]